MKGLEFFPSKACTVCESLLLCVIVFVITVLFLTECILNDFLLKDEDLPPAWDVLGRPKIGQLVDPESCFASVL